MPLVSVIIPSFNHAAFIVEAIESVLNQSYGNIEIIVVDDGSSDNTKEVLKNYIARNQITYVYQSNKGLSAARNSGLALAKGRYVKFLDSDDYIYRWQIAMQVEALERDGNAISNTDFECVYSDGTSLIQYTIIPKSEQLSAYVQFNRGAIHSYLFRTDSMREVNGFDEHLTACEDLDCSLRLLQRGNVISKINYVGCGYRLLDTSMSSNTDNMFKQKSYVFEKLNSSLSATVKDQSVKLKQRLLWSNFHLLHQCLLRTNNPKQKLPYTFSVSEELFSLLKPGFKSACVRWIGFENFLKLHLLVYQIRVRRYNFKLLNEENLWKYHRKNEDIELFQ